MRLDVYLYERGLADSRERAKRLVLGGAVTLNGAVVTKPATEVEGEPLISVREERYVSRGGEKLEAALTLFGVSVKDKRALDIGASTGGFTDCLLQHGARAVLALDTGHSQLHPRLRSDARVTNLEKYNARTLSPADVGVADIVVMDVSFISATYILPQIPAVLEKDGKFLLLIKPQFEAGRAALNKQGIVRDVRDRVLAVRRVLDAAAAVGLRCAGLAPSPILGGDGNEEYIACFYQAGEGTDNRHLPFEKTVTHKVVIQ